MPQRPPSLKPARAGKPWAKRTAYGRLTGRKGVRQRRRRLAGEPLCRRCKERGVIRAAEEWDHIIPLSEGGLDTDANGQPICVDCHREKTREDLARQRHSNKPIA